MEKQEVCPKCGAEVDGGYTYLKSFTCGGFYDKEGKFWRSRPECYEREDAAQQARIEALEGELAGCRERLAQEKMLKRLWRQKSEYAIGTIAYAGVIKQLRMCGEL